MVAPAHFTPDADVVRTLGLDRRGRRRHRILAVLGAAAVAAAVLAWQARRSASGPDLSYETRAVRRGDLAVVVTATGTLQPENVVDIGPEISGRIRKIHVDYNDRVARGDVLVELDTDLLAAQAEQAESQVGLAAATTLQALATRDEAEQTLRRARSLVERAVGSYADLDAATAAAARARAAVAAAQAQERAARASLRVARTNLAKATIRAPVGGVVLSRAVEEGQTVVAALQAPVLLSLAEDLGRMQLVVDVDEADVGRVRAGQESSFTVAAYPERTFRARVSLLRNAPRTRENVVTYGAVLDVDNRDGLLRPGMTGTAQITAETLRATLQVPNAALRYRPAGAADDGAARVYVLVDGRPVARPVTVGASDGTWTAVKDGEVDDGAAVVIASRGPAR
jgi:HlyD family secretion protein